jgi:CheY-like chemotaxis protein
LDLSHAPVVIVDPDPSIADMLCRYLGDRVVLNAKDLDQAAALVENKHPLAVVINLPPDAPLEAWLKPLRGPMQRYDVPVFRCSIPSSSWLQRLTGFADCLTKPIAQEALYQLLERHCPRPTSVLIVDDHPGFVRLVTRMLEAHPSVGEVYSTYQGDHALRLARERKPGLILLDLLMPEMDGFQTLQALRAIPELGETPIIAVTATSFAAEAVPTRGLHFTLSQASGLSEGLLTDLLSAALALVRPAYATTE